MVCHLDLCTVELEKRFDEFEGEAAQPVPVGNIHCLYLSSRCGCQNLVKPRTPEVEPTSDVGDELLSVSKAFLDLFDLSLEVPTLLSSANSSVYKRSSSRLVSGELPAQANTAPDSVDVVVSLSVAVTINDELSLCCPPSHGTQTDTEHFRRFLG
jgi:hypothetical protein